MEGDSLGGGEYLLPGAMPQTPTSTPAKATLLSPGAGEPSTPTPVAHGEACDPTTPTSTSRGPLDFSTPYSAMPGSGDGLLTPSSVARGFGDAITPASATQQKRRSSTRSIKRKKFDDELVESSLAKTDRSRTKTSASMSSLQAASPTLGGGGGGAATTADLPGKLVLLEGGQTEAAAAVTAASLPASELTMEHTRERHASNCSALTEESGGSVAPAISATMAPLVSVSAELTTTAPSGGLTTTASGSLATAASSSLASNPTAPSEDTTVVSAAVTAPAPATPTVPASERKRSKSSSKRSKKSRPPPAASTKDLGRWKPQDDLALINAVQQTCDLTAVYLGVKFTCKFTLKEIQERWYALMYDPILSKLASQAIKQLHPDIMAAINSQALYSKEEETLLGTVTSTSQPTVETFIDLLTSQPVTFHPGRTAKALFNHWLLMKQYHLLPDQSVPPMPKGDHVLNFSDAEDMINDEELRDPKMDALEHELAIADRRQKREVRHLEQELPKWQVLVDSVTGISPPDFDNQTLAVLRGRLVRYLMRSREITLGRATKDNQIDVDLSLEGPAWKISRRQGLIKLRNSGDFYLANEGRRPIYIDGKPVLAGGREKLDNNSVVEISCLRFIFLVNLDLINVIRQEATKLSS